MTTPDAPDAPVSDERGPDDPAADSVLDGSEVDSATPPGAPSLRAQRKAALAEEKRVGAALVRATKPFSEEDIGTTWRLWWLSVAVWAVFLLGALAHPWWPVQLVCGSLAGLTGVRMFIFFHDWMHGAVFRDSRAGTAVMTVMGWYVLTPPPVWQETHDYHHQNNAKMLGAAIGSYPTVTVRMWAGLTPSQQFWYRFARNPATMVFGYFTVFIAGMCVASFAREPKTHWQGPAALVVHFSMLAAVAWFLGPFTAFAAVFLPLFVACATGSYLFYAQHNFPGVELRQRDTWTYHHAALKASSMFDMPAVMHWFTGNIGYHHVHHLNHKIPFYRLPEAMDAIPELRAPCRTSWSPTDIASCLRLKLWDTDKGRMVSWEESGV